MFSFALRDGTSGNYKGLKAADCIYKVGLAKDSLSKQQLQRDLNLPKGKRN